jgi:hypothetical protein
MSATTRPPATAESVLDKLLGVMDVEADRLRREADAGGLGEGDSIALADYTKAAAGVYRAELAILAKLDTEKFTEKQLERLERLLSRGEPQDAVPSGKPRATR